MPYITPDRRISVDSGVPPQNPGELNYLVTRLVIDYLHEHGTSYQTINDIIGALEGCKAEFQRRVVGIYEAEKAGVNGDVYTQAPESPQNRRCISRYQSTKGTVRCERTASHEGTHTGAITDPANSLFSTGIQWAGDAAWLADA